MEEVPHQPKEAANKVLDSSFFQFCTKYPRCLTHKTYSITEHRATWSLQAQEYVAELERMWKIQTS